MGIGDDRAGAVRNDRAGELGQPDQRALGVDVRVDERRADPLARNVEPLACLRVGANAGDDPVGNGHVSLVRVAAKDIDDLASGQDEIGGFLALGDAQPSPPGGRVERGCRIGHGLLRG